MKHLGKGKKGAQNKQKNQEPREEKRNKNTNTIIYEQLENV